MEKSGREHNGGKVDKIIMRKKECITCEKAKLEMTTGGESY